MKKPGPCLFYTLPDARIIISNELAIAVRDGYPVSPGHTLIIPRRHVTTFFETATDERISIFDLMDKSKLVLGGEFQSGGLQHWCE